MEGAIRCFREALDLNPNDVTAHLNLGTALQEKHQYDDAISCCHRALALKPDFADARLKGRLRPGLAGL